MADRSISVADRGGMTLPRVWQLCENFSAYDASYVALAEALADEPVPLLTADARLARAVAGHVGVPVILAA